MEWIRSVGTRMRPTCSSSASILTLRLSFCWTWSSLLLATRSTKNCMGRVLSSGRALRGRGTLLEGAEFQHLHDVEEVAEQHVEDEQEGRDQDHEEDDDLG